MHPMPGAWTEPSCDATTTGPIVPRGGSRYVRVPADWPAGRDVRLLLLPAAEATLKPSRSPTAPGELAAGAPTA